jgi:hypothetical protein
VRATLGFAAGFDRQFLGNGPEVLVVYPVLTGESRGVT